MPRPDTAGPSTPSWTTSVLRGMTTSVTGNAQAFGFSIAITVTYGMVNNVQHSPSSVDLVLFALAAVVTFSVANLLIAALAPAVEDDTQPTRVVLVATATDILAVAGAVGVAAGVAHLTGGWVSWVLAPLLAGIVYITVQSVELAVGWRHADDDVAPRDDDHPPGS